MKRRFAERSASRRPGQVAGLIADHDLLNQSVRFCHRLGLLFEASAFKRNLTRIYDRNTGVIIGFLAEVTGVLRVYDIEGNSTSIGEKPLESPAIDPIDLVPFELIASLAAKAVGITARAGRSAIKGMASKVAGREVIQKGAGVGGDLAHPSKTGVKG
jgi:hypothetical protein